MSNFNNRILKVILLLTGSVQSAKKECELHLKQFSKYESLWKLGIEEEYATFQATEPTFAEFETKL